MNHQENKFGIYDPNTRMFYTVPVTCQEDFKKFMETFNELQKQKKEQNLNKEVYVEQFDDFVTTYVQVLNSPDSPFSEKFIQIEF